MAHRAIADVITGRYMPSSSHLVAETNGTSERDPPTCRPRISPVLQVNTAVLKLGLGDKKPKKVSPSEEQQRRGAQLEKEKLAQADASRTKLSVFAH